MKVYAQKDGALSKNERLELAGLFIKAGYTVRLGKMKLGTKTVEFVEYSAPSGKSVAEEDAEQNAGTAAL